MYFTLPHFCCLTQQLFSKTEQDFLYIHEATSNDSQTTKLYMTLPPKSTAGCFSVNQFHLPFGTIFQEKSSALIIHLFQIVSL